MLHAYIADGLTAQGNGRRSKPIDARHRSGNPVQGGERFRLGIRPAVDPRAKRGDLKSEHRDPRGTPALHAFRR
jgi:hypothetical protein